MRVPLKKEVGLGLPDGVRLVIASATVGAVYVAAHGVATVAGHSATVAGIGILCIGLVLAGLWGAKALAFVAALLGVAGYANLNFLTNLLPSGPQPAGALVRCPTARLSTGWAGEVDQQVGTTGAFAYSGASVYARGTRRYPAGCVLDFDGYCVGESLRDLRSAAPDTVWYRRGKDFIAGATITPISTSRRKGDAARPCPGSVPPPRTPAFLAPLARALSGHPRLAVVAPYAEMVGFAAYFDNVPGSRGTGSWHRISVDRSASGGFHVTWDTLSAIGKQRVGTQVTVVAVPCLALNFPASVQSTRDYTVVPSRQLTAAAASPAEGQARFSPRQRIQGRREACRDPRS